jgi:hypothetical protein
MKNISILILLTTVAVLFAVATFLLKQESKRSALPYPGGRNSSDTVAELRKTEVALQQIERLQMVGDFSLNAPDDLLPERSVQTPTARANDENVFPVSDNGNNNRAGASNLAEFFSGNTAQQNYIGSGYMVPVAVSRSPNENASVKDDIANKPAVNPHEVSFIYISPDIRRAIVDGAFVQEGNVLSGDSRVTAINNSNVTINRNNEEYSLSVPKPLSAYLKSGEK